MLLMLWLYLRSAQWPVVLTRRGRGVVACKRVEFGEEPDPIRLLVGKDGKAVGMSPVRQSSDVDLRRLTSEDSCIGRRRAGKADVLSTRRG